MDTHSELRRHLINLLDMKGAHLNFSEAAGKIPPGAAGRALPEIPYTAWQLVEHMRLAQRDILDFSRNPDHESPPWPNGYWPETTGPADRQTWDRAIESFETDLEEMKELVSDPAQDLFRPFNWGKGQTLLREALLLADHNSYHLGQLVLLVRALGEWPDEPGH